ncbi:Type 1 glutamine amidotransferase-like domain-containing protein [Pseudalkalibacillus berkeleyi]|uniref:Type 1 glutamine amidotransferase-like domain-containing protein n=1 Tax=Pseudalkalibacillus berkeleyi TaxID=1069813 RepID=A0ABS9H3Q7_9BACL|nr:Type 1 glutamine amidotransferase-like domain-containing protein [Pseudalkalibacillus berkeleyi]MCF6138280.1 Type 1 glutamine amidotransferase-like domain-containing protein [Pseudalkalibacillus berkeleyi]
MGNIILCGGGSFNQTFAVNKAFVDQLDRTKPLLYIPIAGDPNFRPYEDSLDYVRSTFEPLGINNIIMWTDVEQKTVEDLNQYSGVYISGGNPFKLLDAFKKSGFDAALIHYFENGGTIYGQSAGASILGEGLEHLSEMNLNISGKACYIGLNLVNNYLIWSHYKSDDDTFIQSYVNKHKKQVIAIPEGTAIFVQNLEMKVIGTDSIYLISERGKADIEPSMLD